MNIRLIRPICLTSVALTLCALALLPSVVGAAPTNPPAATAIALMVDSNGVMIGISPTNFLAANGICTNAGSPGAACLVMSNKTWVSLPVGAGSQGPAGSNGQPGATATIAIDSTITGAPGSSALVTNIGSATSAVFRFTIPAGMTGSAGANGANGANGTNTYVTVTNVLTLAAGSSAWASNNVVGTTNYLTLGIPTGGTGAQGIQGIQGIQGVAGPQGPLTNNLNAAGYSITNGSFIGNGSGITNLTLPGSTDTFATVTSRGATTPTAITVSNDITSSTFMYSPDHRIYSGKTYQQPGASWTNAEYRAEWGACVDMQAYVFCPWPSTTNANQYYPWIFVSLPGNGKTNKFGVYTEALRIETNGNITLGGKLDMGGYSITNIGTNSIYFTDGTKISAATARQWSDGTGTRRRMEGPLVTLLAALILWFRGHPKVTKVKGVFKSKAGAGKSFALQKLTTGKAYARQQLTTGKAYARQQLAIGKAYARRKGASLLQRIRGLRPVTASQCEKCKEVQQRQQGKTTVEGDAQK